MKRIILIGVLVVMTFAVSAQEKSSSNAKWKETKNGVTYEMEVNMTNKAVADTGNPHISLMILGETTKLTKMVFTQKNDLYVTVPVSKEKQDISVAPGLYTLKCYHQKLGEQTFDIEIKKNENKEIVLTLK